LYGAVREVSWTATFLAYNPFVSVSRLARCALLAAAALGPAALAQDAPPLSVGGDARVHPDDFEITVFASALPYPMGALQLRDGSLLFGTSRGGSLFVGPHDLVRLVDANSDGISDGPGSTLFSGLPGPAFSIHQTGDVIIAATQSALLLLRTGIAASDPLVLVGRLGLSYPEPWSHNSTSVVGVRRASGAAGRFQLLFNLGSQQNAGPSTGTVAATNMLTAALVPDSIHLLTVDDTGTTPGAIAITQIASGLRNAFAGGLDPLTGDLHLAENGMDTPGNLVEPLSADELDVVAAGSIGGPIESFGFPGTYVRYRTGEQVGSGGLPPLIAFQPIPPPNGAESEGASSFAFAPFHFPPGLERGVFIGFHGQFGSGGSANEENPLLFADLTSGQYFHFIASSDNTLGHPDTLLATADALFVIDVSSAGALSGAPSGSIYRIGLAPGCGGIGGDLDHDGICDLAGPACSCRPANLPGCTLACRDNCPRRVNPDQLDLGRAGAAAGGPDGIGDTCTCGDLDLDGDSDGADLSAYRRRLVGAPAPFSRDLCNLDTSSGTTCDLRDVVRLARLLAGNAAGIASASACLAFSGP